MGLLAVVAALAMRSSGGLDARILHQRLERLVICRQCQASFKSRIEIDGKIRNLKGRKYCLECSPFGAHNTRKLGANSLHVCSVCHKMFGYSRVAGDRKTVCASCRTSEKRLEKKRRAVEYKGGACEKCGYSRSISALQFHHRDPATKTFSISNKMSVSWPRIKAEVEKCDLLCANCHAEHHEQGTSRP